MTKRAKIKCELEFEKHSVLLKKNKKKPTKPNQTKKKTKQTKQKNKTKQKNP